ncbi:MAG: hypothetical protein Q4P83_05550 [Spirochaetales bacterium]|nr:hypothetical protein [Spirochaetales bacterium]
MSEKLKKVKNTEPTTKMSADQLEEKVPGKAPEANGGGSAERAGRARHRASVQVRSAPKSKKMFFAREIKLKKSKKSRTDYVRGI